LFSFGVVINSFSYDHSVLVKTPTHSNNHQTPTHNSNYQLRPVNEGWTTVKTSKSNKNILIYLFFKLIQVTTVNSFLVQK